MINFPGTAKQAAALKAIFNNNNLMTVTTAKKTIHWKTIESLFAKGFIDTCFKGYYVTDFAINRFFILPKTDNEPTIEDLKNAIKKLNQLRKEDKEALQCANRIIDATKEKYSNAVEKFCEAELKCEQLNRTIELNYKMIDRLTIENKGLNQTIDTGANLIAVLRDHKDSTTIELADWKRTAIKRREWRCADVAKLQAEKQAVLDSLNAAHKRTQAAEKTAKHYQEAYNAAATGNNEKAADNHKLSAMVRCYAKKIQEATTIEMQLRAQLEIFETIIDDNEMILAIDN